MDKSLFIKICAEKLSRDEYLSHFEGQNKCKLNCCLLRLELVLKAEKVSIDVESQIPQNYEEAKK